MDKKYILFDLDGTLTNPKEGITKCAQYALMHMGIKVDNPDDLLFFIGPPLDESFMKFYGMSEEEAWVAIGKFRERFKDIGIFENELYAGIDFLLETLKEAGKTLVLATSKPEEFAFRILEKYGIDKYFDIAVGSMMNGDRKHKYEVIEEAILRIYNREYVISNAKNQITCEYEEAESFNEIPDSALEEILADSIMVGDRSQDINGAHQVGMECVGVSFGYAKENELEDAGADYIVDSIPQLAVLMLMGE